MKNVICRFAAISVLVVLLLLPFSLNLGEVTADTQVKGHYRTTKSGKRVYVRPHTRKTGGKRNSAENTQSPDNTYAIPDPTPIPDNTESWNDVLSGKYQDKPYVEPTLAPLPESKRVVKASDANPDTWTGRCVGVSDGDTISVILNSKPQKIRLYGIDAPESKQAFGTRAKQFTSQMVFGKAVTVYSKGKDRYNRVLGWVFVGRTCVNAEIVKNGLAWWYKQYSPKEVKLQQLESEARTAKRGLWADKAPVAPWNFRKPNL